MELDYPFKRYYIDIYQLIELAQKYNPVFITKNKNKNVLFDILKYNKKLSNYQNDYLIILTDVDSSYYRINDITDFFTEYCRVSSCRREYNDKTPFEYFNENKIKIVKELIDKGRKISFQNLNRYMENSKMSPCSNYKLTYLLGILKHFNPKRWLDLSAGWGDRLCAAYLHGVDYYYGIDPSNCTNDLRYGYQNIINFFESNNFKTQAFIHKGAAETSPLVHKNDKIGEYDFIFTSPPFYTFELYDESNELQSTNQYKSTKDWLENFLFYTINKSWKYLKKGGNYVMYIEDKKDYPFIKDLLEYMEEKKDCKYNGVIYQAFLDKRYPKKPYKLHTVYSWSKIY